MYRCLSSQVSIDNRRPRRCIVLLPQMKQNKRLLAQVRRTTVVWALRLLHRYRALHGTFAEKPRNISKQN